MLDTTIYHLYPKSAFHFGVRGIEQEETGVHFPADSLFAALLATWAETGGDPGVIADLFPQYDKEAVANEPPFVISSLFPRVGEVRFYPALPLMYMLTTKKITTLTHDHRLKEVKKIKFISEKLFQMIVDGQTLDEWLPANHDPSAQDKGLYLQGSLLWMTQDEVNNLDEAKPKLGKKGNLAKALRESTVWKVNKVPRVTVDRINNASQIYHTGRIQFRRGCGLWFGINWHKPDTLLGAITIQQGLEKMLAILADSGLGAERSSGYGSFDYEKRDDALPFSTPSANQKFVTLSRYHPQPIELPGILEGEGTAYNLFSVSGWVKSPTEAAQRRRRVWLFQEGSVLNAPSDSNNFGDIVDVRPTYAEQSFSHPVWRYGLAFPIALKTTDTQEN